MQITSGDGFRLSNGRFVRVAAILDTYDRYDVDESVGHEPETLVRYSHWWSDDHLIGARTDPLDEFVARVEEHVPADEVPESQSPVHNEWD